MDGSLSVKKVLSCRHGGPLSAWLSMLLLILLGASWGLQFTLLKVTADAGLGEIGILAVAMLLIALLCLVALLVSGGGFRPERRHIQFFVLSGLFGFVLPLGGIVMAAEYLSAGLIVLFESLTPVFTVALALVLGSERLDRRRLLAVAIGLLSVALVGWDYFIVSDTGRIKGLLIVLVVPLAYAIDGIYVASRWPSDLRTLQVVTGEAVAGALIVLPLFIVFEAPAMTVSEWHRGHVALLSFTSISLLEIVVYFYLLKTVGALYVSMASFIALLSGICFGMLLLGEQHSTPVWLAVGLVCIALYLVNYRVVSQPGVDNT